MRIVALLLLAIVNLCAAQEPTRHCQPAQWPKRLPALDAVMDSVGLFDLIDTSAASDTASVVVSILYKENGSAAIRLVDSTVAPSPLGIFALQAMSRGLRRVPPPSPVGALRVRIRGGPARSGTVERSVYCTPEITPGTLSSVPQLIRVEVQQGDRMPRSGRVRLDIQTFIDGTGHVTEVRVISSSGMRELDESVVADQRRFTYLPATLDGVPVASWTRSNGTKMRL
jgi:TonB family protein